LPWEQLVLSTVRRDDDGCAVPEPDLELLLRAVWAAAVGERQSGALADPAHLRALVERLLGAAAVAKLPDLDAAVRQALPAFVTGARRAAIAVRRPPVVQSGGLVVAFVGCDGSGKSTVTREIEQWLGQALRVDRAYLGSGQGSSSLLRWPLLLVHRLLTRLLPPRATAKASSPPAGSAPAEVAVAPAGPRGLRARLRPIWALALAREKVGKLRAVLRARQQGAVVICDRYPQNEIMGFNDGPLLHGWRQHRSGLCRALARWEGRPYAQAEVHPPDLVVKLCVSAAVALARKPDMNAPEVARRIAAIEMLRFGRDTRTLLVDADAPLAAVLRAVKTGIWGEL
jgi:hypothetical protein